MSRVSVNQPVPLPFPLRAWTATRHVKFRGRARVGTALVRRYAAPGVTYGTPGGVAMTIDPNDYFQACMLLGIYDPETSVLIDQTVLPGSVVFDIGHHIGYFTLKLARAVGPTGEVHAFDPDPRAHDRLQWHVAANQASWIVVNQLAVGNSDGVVPLLLPDQLGWASTKPVIHADFTIEVRAVTLDAYVADRSLDPARISFIKLDVEAAELEALQGMRATLSVGNPVVVVEIFGDREGQRGAEIFALMDELGYRSCGVAGDVVFARRE